MKTVILSLGGSLIVPETIDVDFLNQFRDLILEYVNQNYRFVIVCGGGRVCRIYQEAARQLTNNKLSNYDSDWVGIKSTKLNAELIRVMFGENAYELVIDNPEDKINTDKKIIIGAGYVPGCSTDKDAVMLSENFKASSVINLSNIDMAYDKDPKKNKDAKPIEKITWDEFQKIVGTTWVAGSNAPFDPIASIRAKELGINVIILNGKNLQNLRDCFDGKTFIGTEIK